MNLRLCFLIVAVAPLLGCGEAPKSEVVVKSVMSPSAARSSAGMGGMADYRNDASAAVPAKVVEVFGGGSADKTAMMAGAKNFDPTLKQQAQAVSRKILYSADVSIVVEDFPRATDAMVVLVRKFGGYVADNDVTGSPGNHRVATWKVRVPVDRFDDFLDSVAKLGELERKQLHSQDVTEEFFDLETRIKNKKVEEDRLVKHLTESTGKLPDILAVEREISRVREEIERMEGRIRLLANLAELTTINVIAHERTGFVPATAPSFATRASRTFTGSAQSLIETIQYVTLLAISVLPWLPFWFVVISVLWLLLRARRRRSAAHSSIARPVEP